MKMSMGIGAASNRGADRPPARVREGIKKEYDVRSLRDRVVVITGASSGIGRATALAFARQGARVVISARRKDRLNDVAEECLDLGAQCLPVPCDVSDEKQVRDLAELSIRRFGRIDVWVNDAGVIAYGPSHEVPEDIARQVIETNLMGSMFGARAALRQFHHQGQGVLINVASIAGKVGHPHMSAYSASKYGIVGLSDALRAELRNEPDIHVCTVLPAGTDTPLFQHAANYSGLETQPPPPIYRPRRVARAIVSLARHPRRELAVGATGKFVSALHRLAPGLTERAMAGIIDHKQFRKKQAPPQEGNLNEPTNDPYAVTGGWKGRASSGSSSLVANLLGIGVVALGTFALYSLLRSGAERTRQGTPDWEEQMRGLSEVGHIPEGAELAQLASSSSLHLDRAR